MKQVTYHVSSTTGTPRNKNGMLQKQMQMNIFRHKITFKLNIHPVMTHCSIYLFPNQTKYSSEFTTKFF